MIKNKIKRRLQSILALFLSLWFLCNPVQIVAQNLENNSIYKITLVGNAQRARLTLTMPKAVEINSFFLNNPYRLVLELPEQEIDANISNNEKQTLIANVRHGLFSLDKTRIIMQATKPIKIERLLVLPSIAEEKARLVLDVVETDQYVFENQVSQQAKLKTQTQKGETAIAELEEQISEITKQNLPLIVIDPGHGGIDAGATSQSGKMEKDIVFEVAKKLQKQLLDTKKFRVQLTRNKDIFIALDERVRIARRLKADLFLSIHADSISQAENIRGATIYTVGDRASDNEAALLATKENSADALAGIEEVEVKSEVTNILAELTKRETKQFTYEIANLLVDELRNSTKLSKIPQRSAGFRVLRAPDIPSILLELGYISSNEDLKLLLSDEWQLKMTKSMTVAIEKFFNNKLRIAN